MAHVLVVGHAVAAVFLCGLTWTVAIVVYPGFAESGEAATEVAWRRLHEAHGRRMTWTVGPMWAVEGVTAAGLLIARPASVPFLLPLVAAVGGLTTVGVTVLRAVPLHLRLSRGFDPSVLRQLQQAHLWRSLAWGAASVAGVAMAVMI